MQRSVWALALVVLITACASGSLAIESDAWSSPSYPLDVSSRWLESGQKLPCEEGTLELVSYRGDLLRYQKPLRVHPAFKTQLSAFERIVDEVARKHFGRPPSAIQHFGAFACRAMRNRAYLVSEHAFGNAIDVSGFSFAPVTRKQRELLQSLPKPLRKGFTVRVDKHWDATGDGAALSAFLRELADRLIERPDVFRAFVGPGFPGHDNHFHLAHPPYRLVKVGQVQRWF